MKNIKIYGHEKRTEGAENQQLTNMHHIVWSMSSLISLRSIVKATLILTLLLTLGVGHMWGNVTHVVGMASSNSNNYTVKVNCKSTGGDGCGEYWSCEELTKAGITFEGKKLYVGSYTSCFGWIYNMQFQYYNGGSQVSSHDQYAGSAVEKYYDNYIYNYDAATKAFYGAKTVETGARFYFDATGWSETSIKLVVGHANYQRYSTLTRITNTNLYYGNSGNKWTDAMGIGVVGNTSASDGANWLTNVSSKAKEYTGFKNYGLTSTGTNNVYLCVNNGKAGEEPTMSYFASHYANDALNYTLTMKYAVSTNGATPTELTSDYIPADITVSTYKFVSGTYNSVSSSSLASAMTKGGSTYSSTVTAARTAATTFTVSNVHDDYAFVGWYTAASGGTELSTSTTYTTYSPTASATIYARFNHEKNHTVTVSYTCASPSATVSTATTPKIGEVTYSSQTAPTVKGYTFVNWTLGTGLSKHSSDALTSNPIHVITNNSGSGYTLTANYTEDLSSTYKLRGSWTNGWSTTGEITMAKKSGHSTEDWVYCTKSFTTSETTSIKVYNSTGGAYYGAHDASNELKKTAGSLVVSGWTLEDPGNDVYFRHDISGTYEFGYNTETHEFKVTWPDVNQLYVSAASPTDATNTNAFDLSAPSSNVRSKTLTLNANTTYTFKIVYGSDWYGNNSGAYTRSTSTSSDSKTLNTSGGNLTLTTDYAGDYTFKFNQSTKTLSIDFPEAYKIHFERGAINGGKVSNYPIATQVETSTSVTSDVTWVKAGNTVTLTAAQVKDGGHYIWYGWYTVQNPDRANPSTNRLGTSLAYTTPAITSASNKNFYAVYFETEYWVNTWVDGQGTISPAAGQNAYIETLSGNFTASPGTGYKFDNWTQSSGALTITSPNSTTTTVNATAASVLQANFSPRWSVMVKKDGGEWCATNANLLTGYGEGTIGYADITLDANSNYEIKIYDRQTSTWYGGSVAQNIDYEHSGLETVYTIATTSTPYSVYLQSAAEGTYRFAWNLTGYKIAVQYPTSWYITSGQKTEGQDDNAGGSFTAVDNGSRDVTGGKFVANGASVTFEATPNTGYNFDGWYTNEACTEGKNTSNPMTVSSITANKTVYAKFVPKTYTVTLTRSGTGYGSGGTASVTATYNQTLPAATMPTAANGYAFMGYYTSTGGEGSQIINASGVVQTVDGYTDGDKKWIRDADTELFAYFKKAEITALTLDATIVAPGNEVGVTPTVEPTPTGDTKICWRLLHGNGNPLEEEDQPTFTFENGKLTFPASSTSGTYLIEAKLRTGSSCDAGTVLDSVTASFQVAGDHTVTVQYKCGSEVIAPSTTVTGKPLEWTAVGVSNIFGYIFSGWSAGDGVTIKDGEGSANPTHIKATYDGYLTANYTKIDYIYFKNTMGWSNVYVYFYTSDKYWDNTEYGSGANKDKEFKNGDDDHHKPYWDVKHGQLTQIEGTDIWYFDAGSIGCADWSNIVFNANDQNGYNWFSATELVRRGDFNKGTPMFVPADKTTYDPTLKNTNAKYYNKGYWINYLGERTGYTLEIYNSAGSTLLKSIKFLSEAKQMPMEVKVYLEENQTYKFQLRRDNDIIYGNDGTMSYTNHGQVQPWKFESGKGKCTFTSTVAGDYTFHLSYSKVENDEYHLRIGIDIPIQTGDYRVIYKDGVHTGWKPSAVVPKVNNGKDTVSFFIRPNNSPEMKIQQATVNASTGAITWNDYSSVSTSTLTALQKDSVYNVCMAMDGVGAISPEKIEPYTGNFYIRTDVANSKWDNYRSDPDHLMTYSEYSITHGGYSHYYCHWVTTADAARKNVKFCIANDYSPCVSDTLTRETASGEWANIESFIESNGDLKRSANVRFMWDQHTNTIRRAYLDPAKNDDNFLVLESADSKIANASEVVQTSVVFSDNENWIYEANVKAKPGAQIKLVATWGDATTIVQYFKGSSSSTETLITGSGTDWYDIRLIYDYKTNRLIAALLPSGNITGTEPINADVMFIREHQGDISQVTFTGDGKLTDIKIAYGVLRFNKWTLNNKDKSTHLPLDDPKSYYERALYFISFPFEVKLSEVFGFGTYAQDWIIEYYDGAARAATGWWEGEPGFWRYVWNRKDFVLEPNKGYLLELELGNYNEDAGFWSNNNERIELFFPSSGDLGTITNTTVNCSIPEHACTINRHATEGLPDTPNNPHTSYNRTIFDSHWNVMSVPTYVNATPNEWNNTTWTTAIGPKFLYTWNSDDNTLTATSGSGFTYHAMHAYMVQYGGNVQWETSGTGPASIVARNTYAEQPKEVEFRIEIQQNEKMVDQTFVIMSNEDEINANFQFGEDMSKDFNARNANIYTMTADNVAAAGNSLPMSENTTIVPIGVSVKKTGDYTFSIPDGTNGVGITLIDEETGIRTSLSALDYTVELAAGDYTERFWLEISPVKGAETGIDPGVDARENGVRKVMIDGLLYIVRDGKMFDATGKRVE